MIGALIKKAKEIERSWVKYSGKINEVLDDGR